MVGSNGSAGSTRLHQVDGGGGVLLDHAKVSEVKLQQLGEKIQLPHDAFGSDDRAVLAAGQEAEDQVDVTP